MQYVEVDGSQGEGGGQVLRTAVAFSAIQQRPVRISKVRAGRKVPGLKRQHLAVLEVLAKVFDGQLTGAFEGSTEVSFAPGRARLNRISMDMKTAASITLVLQAVVPATAISGTRLSLELTGGTDVPWSPTFDYFAQVVRNAYAALGIRFGCRADRRGYYPRGGGRVTVEVERCDALVPVSLVSPPRVKSATVVSRCARLPVDVAERQLRAATGLLGEGGITVGHRDVTVEDADSPGSSILTYFSGEGAFIGCDAIGARGKPAEEVGREAAGNFAAAIRSGACLDANLADMVLPILSMAPDSSAARIPSVSAHLRTGLEIAKQFTSCDYAVEQAGAGWVVTVKPSKKG